MKIKKLSEKPLELPLDEKVYENISSDLRISKEKKIIMGIAAISLTLKPQMIMISSGMRHMKKLCSSGYSLVTQV